MYISYEYYRIFYHVARCGNLTRAAQALQSNQPNLTRAVKNLEAELGCALFLRTNRGMVLTPEGDELFRHVRVACAELEAGEMAVTQSRDLTRGSVFLAASEGALRCLLLPVLKQFQTRYPGVHLRISNFSTPQAVAALRETTADFAVVTTPVTLPPSLVQRDVRAVREVAVCAQGASILPDDGVTLAQLAAQPLITLGAGTASHAFYAAVFAAHGVPFRPEAGLGVGIVPRDFIRPSDRVRVIDLAEPIPPRSVCLIRRKDRPLSAAARALETMITEAGKETS